MPQAPLSANTLFMTVSFSPPDTVIPVPVGPLAAAPLWGVSGLLLLCTSLSMNTQQEWVWVIELVAAPGQSPFWGAGASPSIWLSVSNPSLLLSNWECSI